jgi:hypothetical protein
MSSREQCNNLKTAGHIKDVRLSALWSELLELRAQVAEAECVHMKEGILERLIKRSRTIH